MLWPWTKVCPAANICNTMYCALGEAGVPGKTSTTLIRWKDANAGNAARATGTPSSARKTALTSTWPPQPVERNRHATYRPAPRRVNHGRVNIHEPLDPTRGAGIAFGQHIAAGRPT